MNRRAKPASPKVCVYTALMGGYEDLNEQKVANESHFDFICFTDSESLESGTWDVKFITPLFDNDPQRSQRHIKIKPQVYLGDYDVTIYIDNSILLLRDPVHLLEQFDLECGLMLAPHSFRSTVLDEFIEVSRIGLDDVSRIMEQMGHYYVSSPGVMMQKPFWGGLIVRDSRSRLVIDFQERWFSHVCRYSRRDQLSLNYCLDEIGIIPQAINIDNHLSDIHSWPNSRGRKSLIDKQSGYNTVAQMLNRHTAYEDKIKSFVSDQVNIGALQSRLKDAQSEIEDLEMFIDYMQDELDAVLARLK
ncbi:hypothetical protein LNAOJCKE_2266 [Methylorubrum aminovorans]|uniref:TOD1/MUCI70 glycosyltransferase-like domain-containing protein n=1 Tax=Methylorubrum aminovorans TaxID=269069 RepID=A0ABQ4UDG9_9HYPH|nr:glycosyltransferase domain-containing protein [Methylorubrum aminovorans]GJE65058.1 hypothetical protein LNAOJCKE_2266 [Methylorubrum aminovorans]GMA74518.1 hypothetical protein GCM10025880_09350 [Methylorubrum aminovorans]